MRVVQTCFPTALQQHRGPTQSLRLHRELCTPLALSPSQGAPNRIPRRSRVFITLLIRAAGWTAVKTVETEIRIGTQSQKGQKP